MELDKSKFTFNDIGKHEYSDYQYLPYIMTSNEIDITVIRKRLFHHDEWLRLIQIPIDHVGDKKITKGKLSLSVISKRKNKNLVVEYKLINDY